jgi:phospholipid/cholesterol/gamma-HCH transport system permease protein
MIGIAVVRELSPLLVATLLVVRVGGEMVTELAALRTITPVDAWDRSGVDPVHHLATQRLLACMLVSPLLTILANWMGIVGGALTCIGMHGVEAHFYWQHTRGSIGWWDLTTGLIKSASFGGVIAVSSGYCAFRSDPGPEGAARAIPRACVASFAAVLVLDFFLSVLANNLYAYLHRAPGVWPASTFPW